MSDKSTHRSAKHNGFTLLEVLVALTIATLMIVIVAPLSRHIVKTISTIRIDLAGLSLTDAATMQAPAVLGFLDKNHSGLDAHTRFVRLAPFDYSPSSVTRWQPVLVAVDLHMPDGRLFNVEKITLQREAQ